MRDKFIENLSKYISDNNLDLKDVADALNIDEIELRLYLNEDVVPSFKFISEAQRKFEIDIQDINNFENIFVQGYFGTKIPLLINEDFEKDNLNKVVAYYEIPHLNKLGENTLFALRYTGNNIIDKGIFHDSILIFQHCTEIDRNGIYAVVKRGRLCIKEAELTEHGIRITPLDSVKRISVTQKTSVASGRLVSCINNF